MSEARTFTLAIDPELHNGREPEDEVDRIVWETLDTVWNVLRESAVRVTLVEIRSQLEAKGFTEMPSDEELFAKADEDPTLPKNYLDLAVQRGDGPVVDLAGSGLFSTFELLVEQTFADAAEGLGLSGVLGGPGK